MNHRKEAVKKLNLAVAKQSQAIQKLGDKMSIAATALMSLTIPAHLKLRSNPAPPDSWGKPNLKCHSYQPKPPKSKPRPKPKPKPRRGK